MGHRTLSANAIQAFQQAASTQAARASGNTSGSGTTVLHQTILTNKQLSSATHTTLPVTPIVQPAVAAPQTPSIVAQPVVAAPTPPTVVVPVETQLATITNVGNTVTVATTPSEPVGQVAPACEPQPEQGVATAAERSNSPDPELSDLQSSTPDSTRTYAMRPRKAT